jgi:ribosomal protein S18 acetylase RimI-like enzyme
MTSHDIRPITAQQTMHLRHSILRPHQKLEEQVYPYDSAPNTFHAGAFIDDKLVGIATVGRNSSPNEQNPQAWQLRGMAVIPELQRQGFGAALVRACIKHIAAHGGNELWCNGRTSASSFYRSLGFRETGDEFITPMTGPHFVFKRDIHADEA